jgi:flagellar motor protein MotB
LSPEFGEEISKVSPEFGDTKPIDSNKTAEGWANNRRVEFVRI